ncbi:MAG: phage tail tape measure protein [[Clostridium] innocuum]
MSGSLKLAPLMMDIKVDIANFKSDMGKIKTEAVARANEVSKQMEKTIKVGNQMSNVGGKLTKTVTLPLAGAGIAATKMAVDYESSFAKVSTLLDKNVVDYGKYKNDILDASSKSKVAVGEFSEAVYGSISAGVDQTKAIKFTTDAMKLAKGGFTDGAKAVDVMTTAINGYGMKAEDATKISDMLITTQNLGKTTVDELASSMGAVIPVANSVNFGIDELSAAYAQLTKNGIATAESGTYLKSMLSELGKSGSITDKTLRELTGKGFADLKKEGKATSDIIKLLDDDAKKNGKSLKDMFGSVEAGTAAMVLAKGSGKEYDEMLAAMQKSAGATQEAFDKMDATPAEQLKGALNELKNEAIKLGAKAIPIVTEAAKFISKLVDGFTKLSPAMQENIIKFGLVAAAAGPVLKIAGGLVTTYGKLKPLVSGATTVLSKSIPALGKLGSYLATHSGLLGKVGSALSGLAPAGATAASGLAKVTAGAAGMSTAAAGGTTALTGVVSTLGGLVLPAAGAVAAIGGVALAGKAIYDNLQKEVIPSIDLFADRTVIDYNKAGQAVGAHTVKISEETQKQLSSYLKLSNDAQQLSMNMYTGITAVTDKSVGKISSKVDEMANSVTSSIEKQKNDTISKYQEMFTFTKAITKEEQADILKTVNDGYQQRINKTKYLKDQITGIYKEIKDNGGKITKSQQERIDQLYDQMKTEAVQSMSSSKAEQEVILNRLNESSTKITADMAGKAIKEMNKIESESVKSAGRKRDELVRQAEELKTIEGGKYEEKAQKIIDAANKEYKEAVKNAKRTKTEGIDKLMDAHQELADKVDIKTGDVVSKWTKMFGKWDQWHPGDKEMNIITNYIETHTEIKKGVSQVAKWFNANGNDYIPYDGYNARLHKGERVLTAKENEEYTAQKIYGKGNTGAVTLNVPLYINGKEFAHATVDDISEEMGFRR